MHKYITYDIEAVENLKLSKTNVQVESESTIDYITGSSVRGAYIYRYISKRGIQDINEGEHREKLLEGGIKFLNAYPRRNNLRAIPFPKCYFSTKDEMKLFKMDGETLKIESGLDRNLESGKEKVRSSEFVSYSNGDYRTVSVGKTSSLHINKSSDKNKLYRYEAIKKGQEFSGIIKVEDEKYLEEVIDLLEDTVIYIGGSKGSGYGKCLIKNMKVVEQNPEPKNFQTKEMAGEIYLIAMSDIIYRNELGEYTTYLSPELLEEELGISSVEYRDSSIETKNISTFNNKWKCRTPQVVGIKAGSVFKYSFDGSLDEKKLSDFMDKGLGIRKSEGFGRFLITGSMLGSKLVKNKDSKVQDEKLDLKSLTKDLDAKELEILQIVADRVYENRVDRGINLTVLKIDEKLSNQVGQVASQWGNWKGLFNYLKTESPDLGKEKFEKYMTHIEEKRSKSFRQIQSVKYDGGDFKSYLRDTVKNSISIDAFRANTDIKPVEMGIVRSKIDSDFTYMKTMKILEELCRYQIRKDKEEKANG